MLTILRKTLLGILFVLILCTLVFSQNKFSVRSVLDKSQLSDVERAVNFYWNPKSKEDPKKAVKLLEEIIQKDSDNWVASYWIAYISTQIFRSGTQNKDYLDKAQIFFDKSYESFNKKPVDSAKPYFFALRSLIETFKGTQFAARNDMEKFTTYQEKSRQDVEKGLEISPNNPVLMVLAATQQITANRGNFSQAISTVSLLEKAKEDFQKIKDRSPADITYWNEHWIKFWLARAKSMLNMSTFEILPVPDNIKNLKWIELRKDSLNDGRNKNSADGKAFYYSYQKEKDMLWFRFDLHNQISINAPAVSVSFDVDANQNNGINWYGKNSTFKFDKMVSVGPIRKREKDYFGYNGITNEMGVRSQNWVNVKKGNATFFYDVQMNSYFLGIKRSEIKSDLSVFNVIGSVGQNAMWNDDFGEEGYSTVKIDSD